MTDYIDEMMETAACEEKRCPNNVYDELCKKYEFCNNAPHCKIYPDFTAEKQLEIENLIINHKFPVYDFEQEKYIAQYTPFGYFIENNKIVCCAGAGDSFERVEAESRTQALAQLTIELMNAGKLDKEKVKEILER